ncbi:MAG: peptide deformylase, partial [Proteobacteria bacterium]|nr:peptide deformylase [Pseudomonadota bacterium]
QVGSLKRVIVVDVSDVEEDPIGAPQNLSEGPPETSPKKFVIINPSVASESGLWSMEEGCLSIPELRGEVTRAEEITLDYHDGSFHRQRLSAGGLLARVILHEIDHLDGVLFIDRMSKTRRALLRPDLSDIKNGKVETSYPVVTASEE